MGTKTKKGTSGAVVAYMSRKKCLRYLQVTLPIFNRLCLWKGVYPVLPKSFKKVGKGDATERIYFMRKDINLLLHEPILQSLRDLRAHRMKVKKAKARGDKGKLNRLNATKPSYNLNNLVNERYPKFEDGLKDVGNCITTINVLASLPKLCTINPGLQKFCKKLSYQWKHLVIATRGIRKVYITIPGIVLESEVVEGTSNIWKMPHSQTIANVPNGVDYRLLSSKAEFDVLLAYNVIKRAYQRANLIYPPEFDLQDDEGDVLTLLGHELKKTSQDWNNELQKEEEECNDRLERFRGFGDDTEMLANQTISVLASKRLFQGQKVFINREVPRVLFVMLIRACGGEVSWDKNLAKYAPFEETDPEITIHIIDRPTLPTYSDNRCMHRKFVQPQYICDSINATRLLPWEDYAPGKELIFHLSPWEDANTGYTPLEAKYLKGEITADELYKMDNVDDDDDDDVANDIDESDNEDDLMEFMSDEDEELKNSEIVPVAEKVDKTISTKEIQEKNEKKMREMQIPKKRRNLYNKMKHAEEKKEKDANNLKRKRNKAIKSYINAKVAKK